ncbi:alpha/beta hydrolase [Caulobacter flavus]|uniref:Alpha/beta hydrolase n=1 Tax=Caulobacter flavus TaxID=1679497 RepID=A0A2N5CPE9_9CAUL|nr:alpha/beta hydrolase [Caulobacter flavus]AYV48458.1 alpha/beta hydrolase [Caulobacter flavus]PLR08826.1 alpha/beta hydrolase [Caulobacter flavus]
MALNIVEVAVGDRSIGLAVARPEGAPKAAGSFSHGAFSAPRKYATLLEGWAAAGLLVAAPLHVDSTDHPQREAYDQGAVWRTRLEDQAAALDWLAGQGGEGLAAAGHSFGALLALAAGGASVLAPPGAPTLDARVKAVVALSPPPATPPLIAAEGFTTTSAPLLVQTGDADVLPGFVDDWRMRLIAYEAPKPGDRHALVLPGVDHYFGGLICRPELPGPAQADGLARAIAASADLVLAHAAGDASAAARIAAWSNDPSFTTR